MASNYDFDRRSNVSFYAMLALNSKRAKNARARRTYTDCINMKTRLCRAPVECTEHFNCCKTQRQQPLQTPSIHCTLVYIMHNVSLVLSICVVYIASVHTFALYPIAISIPATLRAPRHHQITFYGKFPQYIKTQDQLKWHRVDAVCWLLFSDQIRAKNRRAG